MESKAPKHCIPLRWIYFFLAVLFLLIHLFTWIALAENLQSLQDAGSSYKYPKPYFINYFTAFGFILMIPVWAVWAHYHRHLVDAKALKHVAIWSMILSVLISVSGYFWFSSVANTPVSANVVIVNMEPLIIFIFGIFLVKEKLSILKAASVIVCMGGVALVVVFTKDSEEEGVEQTTRGYVYTVVSTVIYSLFEILYQKLVEDQEVDEEREKLISAPATYPDVTTPATASTSTAYFHEDSEAPDELSLPQSRHSTGTDPQVESSSQRWGGITRDIMEGVLVSGLTGLGILLLTWPGFFILHYSGVEPFELPDKAVFKQLLLTTLYDTVHHVSLILCISFSSALFISVGSLLSIPISVVADKIFHNYSLPVQSIIGILVLFFGFIMFNYAEYKLDAKTPQEQSKEEQQSSQE